MARVTFHTGRVVALIGGLTVATGVGCREGAEAGPTEASPRGTPGGSGGDDSSSGGSSAGSSGGSDASGGGGSDASGGSGSDASGGSGASGGTGGATGGVDGMDSVQLPHRLGRLLAVEETSEVWVSSRSDGSLLILDGDSLTLVDAISEVGDEVACVAKDEALGKLLTFNLALRTDPLASTVSIVDMQSRTITEQLNVYPGRRSASYEICASAYDPTQHRWWLLTERGLGFVDVQSGTYSHVLEAELELEGWFYQYLEKIAVNPRRSEVYMPDIGHAGLRIYNWESGKLRVVPYPDDVYQVLDVVADPAAGRVFLWSDIGNHLVSFYPATGEFEVLEDGFANYLVPLAFSPVSRRLFTGGQLSSDASLVDADSSEVRLLMMSATTGALDIRLATDTAYLVGTRELVVVSGETGGFQSFSLPKDSTEAIAWSDVSINQETGDVYFLTHGDGGVVRRVRDSEPEDCMLGARDCRVSADRDCDGTADDSIDDVCTCLVGSLDSCDGHPELDGVGRCRAGARTCVAAPDGVASMWSECVGAVGPQLESMPCDGVDEDCDGTVEQDSSLCRDCEAGATRLEFSEEDAGVAIDSVFGTTSSTIAVSNPGVLTRVVVRLDSLAHSSDDALAIVLRHPDGTAIPLSTKNGGTGRDYLHTTFDDRCAVPVASGEAPFDGCFAPESALSGLNGLAADGDWQLELTDDSTIDGGILDSWTLELCVE